MPREDGSDSERLCTDTRRVIRETKEVCQMTPKPPVCSSSPCYLAVTYHADWATGIIMPIPAWAVFRREVDQERLGPTLAIAANLIFWTQDREVANHA